MISCEIDNTFNEDRVYYKNDFGSAKSFKERLWKEPVNAVKKSSIAKLLFKDDIGMLALRIITDHGAELETLEVKYNDKPTPTHSSEIVFTNPKNGHTYIYRAKKEKFHCKRLGA